MGIFDRLSSPPWLPGGVSSTLRDRTNTTNTASAVPGTSKTSTSKRSKYRFASAFQAPPWYHQSSPKQENQRPSGSSSTSKPVPVIPSVHYPSSKSRSQPPAPPQAPPISRTIPVVPIIPITSSPPPVGIIDATILSQQEELARKKWARREADRKRRSEEKVREERILDRDMREYERLRKGREASAPPGHGSAPTRREEEKPKVGMAGVSIADAEAMLSDEERRAKAKSKAADEERRARREQQLRREAEILRRQQQSRSSHASLHAPPELQAQFQSHPAPHTHSVPHPHPAPHPHHRPQPQSQQRAPPPPSQSHGQSQQYQFPRTDAPPSTSFQRLQAEMLRLKEEEQHAQRTAAAAAEAEAQTQRRHREALQAREVREAQARERERQALEREAQERARERDRMESERKRRDSARKIRDDEMRRMEEERAERERREAWRRKEEERRVREEEARRASAWQHAQYHSHSHSQSHGHGHGHDRHHHSHHPGHGYYPQYNLEQARKDQERLDRAIASAYASYERRWDFLSSPSSLHPSQPPLTFRTIPWPTLHSPHFPAQILPHHIESFLLCPLHSQDKSRRIRLRDALLRWHPDKFESRWMKRIQGEEERKAVREGVAIVSRVLSGLMARDGEVPLRSRSA